MDGDVADAGVVSGALAVEEGFEQADGGEV